MASNFTIFSKARGEAAIKNGATKEEIAEALGVATAVNAGAALVYSTRVMDAFKEYPGPAVS
jgi:alkylhydroperoxidase/carboxymuconolactone decarboxylase family protein YurZ